MQEYPVDMSLYFRRVKFLACIKQRKHLGSLLKLLKLSLEPTPHLNQKDSGEIWSEKIMIE